MQSQKIGIIGTGMLGNAVGLHLMELGFDLTVFNRTVEKTERLKKRGAKIANNPKEVAENSELVIIVVKDADAVQQLSFGHNGIVDGKHNMLTIADMSTISSTDSINISKQFERHGIKKLDIPVMGGPNAAESGNLVVMVSGNRDTFEKFREIFEKIGNKVFFVGGQGVANSVKLAMNLQITMLALALSEGITMVRKEGIDPKVFLDILNSTYFKTGMSEKKAYKMIENKFDATFTLENLKKDISTMIKAAESRGLILPMIMKAEEIYKDAVKQGFGEKDYTGILEYIEKINK